MGRSKQSPGEAEPVIGGGRDHSKILVSLQRE